MIIELILDCFFGLVNFIISLIPTNSVGLPNWITSFISFVSTGLSFFPPSVFNILIGNIAFWLTVQMSWAIIEWLYKKVPGID